MPELFPLLCGSSHRAATSVITPLLLQTTPRWGNRIAWSYKSELGHHYPTITSETWPGQPQATEPPWHHALCWVRARLQQYGAWDQSAENAVRRHPQKLIIETQPLHMWCFTQTPTTQRLAEHLSQLLSDGCDWLLTVGYNMMKSIMMTVASAAIW